MKRLMVGIWMGSLLLVCAAAGFTGERVKIKGYYEEDGTYVRPRVIDPIQHENGVQPVLLGNLKWRKKQISDYYEGQVSTAKVSFPASRKGVTIYRDEMGKTNVNLFEGVKKNGAAIEQGEKAIITKFKVGRKTIDIDLNAGGYGHIGDISFRVLTDILTLGLMELRNYDRIRYQEGSRLRIRLSDKGEYFIFPEDLRVDAFKQTLLAESAANDLVLEKLGLNRDQISLITEEEFLSALEKILAMPDFYAKVPVERKNLTKEVGKLWEKANKIAKKNEETNAKRIAKMELEKDTKKDKKKMAKMSDKKLQGMELRKLNKGILYALYPQEIRKRPSRFTEENLTFDNIDSFLSLVLQETGPKEEEMTARRDSF